MLESAWSEPHSELTEETGFGNCQRADARGGEDLGEHSNDAPRRCVLPKVEPRGNRSDQRVPVYWDQTVPVWPCKEPKAMKSSRASEQGTQTLRRSDVGSATSGESSLENCFCVHECGQTTSGNGHRGDGGSKNPAAVDGTSSEVSFDAILSMYQSSLVEKAYKWSRRDWRALCAISNHRSRKRPWRRFAGRFACANADISALKCSRGFFHGRLNRLANEENDDSMRSLQEAIERTSLCNHSSICSSHCGSLTSHAVFRGRSCDFEHQVQYRRDGLKFNAPMLTTSFS